MHNGLLISPQLPGCLLSGEGERLLFANLTPVRNGCQGTPDAPGCLRPHVARESHL